MLLIDSHCHLDAAEFDGDRNTVIAKARAAGVTRQIVPAVDAVGWPKLRDICATDAGLFAAYGLHPMYLDAHRNEHLSQLREWLECERPVAVGECGLDYFAEGLDPGTQSHYFDAQLRLAREFDLPVIVHARRAVDAVIAAIKRVGLVGLERVPVREGNPLLDAKGHKLGRVTSGTLGPTVNAPIAMAYLAANHGGSHHEVYAEVRGKRQPMRVAPMPFIPHRYHRG